MEVTLSKEEHRTLVNVAGSVNTATVSEFDSKVRQHFDVEGEKVELNLLEVHYINSSGLRVVLAMAKNFKSRNIPFNVACTKDVYAIFETVGFNKIIDFDIGE